MTKNHPRPFLLPKGIDSDIFNRKNNENSQKMENCPKIRGLLPVPYVNCIYSYSSQIGAVSPRKKVSQYGVIFYRVLLLKAKNFKCLNVSKNMKIISRLHSRLPF